MAMGSMARPVRFRGNGWLLLLLMLTRCSTPISSENPVVLNQQDTRLHTENGVVYLDKKPFSGTLFSLWPGSSDTIDLATYRDGRAHGIWRQFYPGGKRRQQRVFEQGKKTGDYVAWWPNGQQQLHYHFADGEYEGTCREWNETGRLIQEMNYRNGHEEGSQKLFYNNGKVRANYVIIKGRRYGLLGTKNCVNISDSIFRR